jgi:hypothetical protein
VPWSEFFDVPRFSKGIGIPLIDWPDFLALDDPSDSSGNSKMSVDVMLKSSACNHQQKHLEPSANWEAPEKEWVFDAKLPIKGKGCHGVDNIVVAGENELTNALVAITTTPNQSPLLKEPPKSLFLEYFEKIQQPRRSRYWHIRQHIHHTDLLYEEADRFLKTLSTSGTDTLSLAPPPYISLHYRRKDFVSGHSETASTVQEVAAMLRKKADEYGVATVLIATDASEKEELGALRLLLHNLNINLLHYEKRAEGTLLNYSQTKSTAQYAAVEQILCAKAKVFIGTLHSHFSKEVHLERRLLWGEGTGDEPGVLGTGGPTWRSASFSLAKGGELIPMCNKPTGDKADDRGGRAPSGGEEVDCDGLADA